MSEFTSYAHGTPAWIDLATTDAEDARDFYTGLFGWAAVDTPTDAGIYVMFLLEGKPVAALHEMSTDLQAQGVPPHWTTYVSVDDVDEAAARVTAAGGTVTQPPSDVMDTGRMAAAIDPTSAAFVMWQPGKHFGSAFANQPGSLTWNELQTNDTTAAAAFYTAVFGWQVETSEGGPPYTMFKVGDRAVAGMMAIQPEWGPVPPHWGVYLSVADCDQTVADTEKLGGKVEMPARDIPEVGRFSLLTDRQGAYFYVISGM